MRYSSLTGRIGGHRVTAWDLHAAAAEAQANGEDVIVLSVGDPDFATPAPIVQAAVAALAAGDTHYADVLGRTALRRAIADLHTRRAGQAVGADQVIVLPGAQNALFAACLCLFEAGDEVIVPEPMYLTYEACVGAAGATMVTVPQPRALGLRLDTAALAASVTPRTRAILFANPCNPTGLIADTDELAAIADLARRHDLWVIVDEVYAALAFDHPHVSIAALPGMADRTVTINSLSKSHAMTGWRAGWAVGPRALIEHMGRLAMCMLYGLPGFVMEAALTAVRDYDRTAAAMCAIYQRRRDLVLDRLSRVEGIACLPPEAGMFMLVDVSASGLAAGDFAWALYDATGVAVLDAGAFGPSTEGMVRLSFAAEDAQLEEACRRIGRFVAGLLAAAPVAPAGPVAALAHSA